MSNIDCWSTALLLFDWIGWSWVAFYVDDPYAASAAWLLLLLFLKLVPSPVARCCGTASHSEPTPSRSRAWTARPKLIPVVQRGLEVRSQRRRLGHSVLSNPRILDLVHLLCGSQSLVPDCRLLRMASARRPRSSLCHQPRRVALIGLALPSSP